MSFFGTIWDLNTHLDQQTLPMKLVQGVKPDDKGYSGLSSSIDATAPGSSSTETNHNRDANPPETTSMAVAPLSEDDPFLIEVTTIMEDVESLAKMYIQEMTKTGLQCLGGVKMTSYLGHIFNTRLNFQTSMWQLVMTEAVDLPTVMREQLHWEMGTLCLFAESIPFLRPCLVPPPPLPVVEWPMLQTSKETPSMSGSKPPLPSLPDNSQPTVKVAGLGAPNPIQATPVGSIPNRILH